MRNAMDGMILLSPKVGIIALMYAMDLLVTYDSHPHKTCQVKSGAIPGAQYINSSAQIIHHS